MPASPPPDSSKDLAAAAFCLRGEVDGSDRTFPLLPGDHEVGSSPAAQIFLPVHGVSRRHASITVTEDMVTVLDLGSKNGTRVGEHDVESGRQAARARVGDCLRFGPVKLRLQSMELTDAVLGMKLDSPGASRPPSHPSETSLLGGDVADPLAAAYPSLLATVVDYLTLRTPDLQAVVQLLTDTLEISGAVFVEWRGERASVVAVSPGDLALEALPGTVPQAASGARPRLFETAGLVGYLQRPGPRDPIRGLLVRPLPGTVVPKALLEAVLRIAARLRSPSQALADMSAPARESAAGTPDKKELIFPEFIRPGRSPAMVELYQQMRLLLRGDLPVLIQGETGVGKEHVAATLHGSSDRADGPFVAVNCAAIPADLLEAEMFGIGRGVATGVEAREGEILRADGGTLFLDEVGEIPMALQAKLLRVLQEGNVRPVGRESRSVDVRVLAATNSDLKSRIREGTFRSDLYFRLAGFELEVPPLRDRREDLAPLIATFLERYGAEVGSRISGISVKALAALTAYDWPGNVRELQHEVRRWVYRCPPGQAVDSSLLSPGLLAGPSDDGDLEVLPEQQGEAAGTSLLGLQERVDELQRRLIRRALTVTGGNQTRAAEYLSISRSGLIKRMKRLQLDSS